MSNRHHHPEISRQRRIHPMIRASLITVLLFGILADFGRADDKSQLPTRTPPRLVSVVKVNGDVLSYRDFAFMPMIPMQPAQLKAVDLVPSLPVTGSFFAGIVNFSFKEGTLLDGEGKQIDAVGARKQLKPGDTVLVSTSGKVIDPAYLRVLRK